AFPVAPDRRPGRTASKMISELRFQPALSKQIPQCPASPQPMRHFRTFSTPPLLRIPKDRLEFSTSLKILRLSLSAGQKSSFWTEFFPTGGSARFELFFESPLFAPLRCRNGSSIPTPEQLQRKSPRRAHSFIRNCAGKRQPAGCLQVGHTIRYLGFLASTLQKRLWSR